MSGAVDVLRPVGEILAPRAPAESLWPVSVEKYHQCIVNLTDRRVEVYTDPTDPAAQPDYRSRHDAYEADEVAVVIGGREVAGIAVKELLPRAMGA